MSLRGLLEEAVQEAGMVEEKEQIDIGYGAPGYVAHYVIFSLLVLAHVLVHMRSRLRIRHVVDHCAELQAEGLTQFGYGPSMIGSVVKLLSTAFLVWMQVSLLITIASNYAGFWPFPIGGDGDRSNVSWDSYTRAFLLPWIATFILLSAMRASSTKLQTFYMSPCSLAEATHVRIIAESKDESGNVIVRHEVVQTFQVDGNRLLTFQLLRYMYCTTADAYTATPASKDADDNNSTTLTGEWAHESVRRKGLTNVAAEQKLRGVQGLNEIQITVPTIFAGAVNEFFTFFYIYQFSSVMLSFFWDYITVGLTMLVLVLICGVIKVVTERQQRLKLKEMASITELVWTRRGGTWQRLSCVELCVGDVICVTSEQAAAGASGAGAAEENVLLAADALVVEGSCVVDESLLTGETMPIQKFPVGDEPRARDPEAGEDKKFFLLSGTFLLHATGAPADSLPEGVSDGALAVVSLVGARSTRGNLLRTLLFGAPLKLQMASEAKFVLLLLGLIGVLDFVVVNWRYSFSMSSVLTAVFMIISMVSPLLSVAVLGGQLAAAKRLSAPPAPPAAGVQLGNRPPGEQQPFRVFVRDVDRVALAGKVSVMCFDKTGTITKGGLDLIGFVLSDDEDAEGAPTFLPFDPDNPSALPKMVSLALATTHTVSRLGSRFIGHQVELRMVEAAQAIGWQYDEGMKEVSGWVLERQWTFDHHTMTMSVLVTPPEIEGGCALAFVKGSFEAVAARCGAGAQSEDAEAWGEVVERYSSEGCYVIALAYREVEATRVAELSREEAEQGLTLLGLLAFRNEPKPDSLEHITELTKGGVACVMVTGDSALTGAAVARVTGIVDPAHRVLLGQLGERGEVQWKQLDPPDAQQGSGAAGKAGKAPVVKAANKGEEAAGNNGESSDPAGGTDGRGGQGAREEEEGGEEEEIFREVGVGEVVAAVQEEEGGGQEAMRTEEVRRMRRTSVENGGESAEELDDSVPTSLAVTGEAFEALLQEGLLAELMGCQGCGASSLVHCSCPRLKVFGRMTPKQKVQVVRGFANMSMTVGMCGDGGNDSGALRAAHAGLALSGRAEASVAAPFSTDAESLGSLVLLLREGRASLCTSLAAYRFLIVRGIVWTQAKNVMLLLAGLYLAPLVYVYLDMLAASTLLWAVSLAKPAPRLAPHPPEGSLLGPHNVLGASISVFLCLSTMSLLLLLLYSQPWFEAFHTAAELHNWQARSDNYEAPLFFLFTTWMMVDTAVVYSAGHMYRESAWKNRQLILVASSICIPVVLLLLTQHSAFNCAFKVNCDKATYLAIHDAFINNFLFPYEQIGGEEWFGTAESTTYPGSFRALVLFVLACGSVAHHLVYRYVVLGWFVQEWVPRELGWDDGRAERFMLSIKRRGRRLRRFLPKRPRSSRASKGLGLARTLARGSENATELGEMKGAEVQRGQSGLALRDDAA